MGKTHVVNLKHFGPCPCCFHLQVSFAILCIATTLFSVPFLCRQRMNQFGGTNSTNGRWNSHISMVRQSDTPRCPNVPLENLPKKTTFRSQIMLNHHLGMGQYLLLSILTGWTSIYKLFWGSPGVQAFDPSPFLPWQNSAWPDLFTPAQRDVTLRLKAQASSQLGDSPKKSEIQPVRIGPSAMPSAQQVSSVRLKGCLYKGVLHHIMMI